MESKRQSSKPQPGSVNENVSFKKRSSKIQPVIRGAWIGDPSSSEDEAEEKPAPKPVRKAPVIIGGNDSPPPKKQQQKPVVSPAPKQKKAVIGDTSSDEDPTPKKESTKKPVITTKKVKIGDVGDDDDESPGGDYKDKLSKIYVQKQARHEIILKEKEERLKKYEEEHKNAGGPKLQDSFDSEDETESQSVDKEELWKRFNHQNIEKPVMKARKRRPQKNKVDLNLE